MQFKLRSFVWAGLAVLILVSPSRAQNAVIGSIEVEGNLTADKNLIKSVSGLQEGQVMDFETVQNGIRSVYSLRLFSDLRIVAQEAGDKVNLIIQVKEHPRIRQIVVEGNKKIKKDKIGEVLSIKQGELASPSQVQNGLNDILELYHEKGYPLVEVATDPVPHESGELILKYKIVEGPKVKLGKVLITGNRVYNLSKLKGRLKLKIDNFEEKFQEGKQNLIDFYRDNGYADATMVAESTWYSPDKRFLNVWLAVNEGIQYKFGEVTFEGEKLFSQEALRSRLKFKIGEIYSQKKLEQSLQAISEMYFDQGHLYLQVKDQVKTTNDLIQVHLSLTEGVPAHVNLINIEGNTKTKEKVIRRELFLKPGDLFRRSILMRSLRNVMVLNFFSNVTPDYEVLDNGDVNLTLKIEEKPTGQISFGAGYSERDKLVGTITLGIPNLFGNGQSADLNWDFGKRRNSFSISYTDPWFRDTPTTVGFDLYSLDQRWYSDFTERRQGVGFRAGKRLTWPDNYFRVLGRYRIERILYHSFSDAYLQRSIEDSLNQVLTLNEIDWPQITSAVDFTVLRDSRDLSQFATRGSVASFNSEFSGGFLGGDWNYVKEIVELKKYLRLVGKLVLFGRAKVGMIDSWKDDVEINIPYSERFSPGGVDPDGIIRGYPDGLVGPRSANGELLRGRSVLVYNLELQFPVVEQQLYGILFADAGNAWLTGKSIHPLDFKGSLNKSLGFGIRLQVPMLGMIGFDYGYGFDYTGSDKGRIHFQFGQQF
ncbi:MAG: outer membrane protein assembly factor BamA [candidate division Zixibacteria bacterium RBG_16_50_21]|nr:MAG: outer membrane protein assembly factor BamA [candidate division Zixibacteria bacterium RBG_16_50_21]